MNESPLVDSGCVVLIFSLGDDLIALTTHTAGNGFSNRCSFLKLPLNHNSTRTSSNPRNQALIQDGKAGVTARVVTMLQQSGVKYICAIGNALSLETKENAQWYKDKAMVKLKLRKLEQIWMKSNSHFLVELRVSRWTRAVQQSFQTILLFRLTMLIHYDSDVLMMSSKCKNALLMAIISNYDKLINHVNNWEKANKEQNSESVPAELESVKMVAVTPKNKVKKVRFVEPLTSSSNIKHVESSTISDSNIPVLSPTGLKCSTSNCRSKPTCNKRNDRISRTPKNVNSRAKSDKKHKKQNIWKPTGHVFTQVGLKWKPTGRTFTTVSNSFPLTRITSANVVPPKKTTSHSVETRKPELNVYSMKPKNVKNVGSSKKAKIVESKNANHSEPNHTWGSNATDIPSSSSLVMTGTVRFGNDNIARIMGYGDYQLGNVTISRVYYVEGLGHNLFFVGQFCDADLEVAFRKNTCFICNLEGVDLLSGSRDTNLYIISLDDMLKTSPICLLSKASKTKSWLWHHRLSHLNFSTLNKLAKYGLARDISRLKFQKDHMCSACVLGKSKKSSHQPKAEYTNQEKLYLLYMDLCGLMRVASINGKRYILVIVNDYSRFTWVRFLRTKDKAPEAIIKCIKNIQVCLNVTICNVRTDNETEFVNQTLREIYENVSISHQTSIARTPQ
ncbi:retrovirus-related pol polyprotein from transposon TNT 1-94 [Tanacetum coccineum]|uniref:Retrovirus-related pol polyprotein from transposon TNT 1-94 n=1 Tax=Tanacetum coccineum TaxID=301880 RepID=A0ABQ5GZ29_9ASTR